MFVVLTAIHIRLGSRRSWVQIPPALFVSEVAQLVERENMNHFRDSDSNLKSYVKGGVGGSIPPITHI